MATITRIAGSVESYAHKAAKATLVQWFRDAAAADMLDKTSIGYIKPAGVSWRINRGAPFYGVWEEYPVTASGDEIEHVWDECGFHTQLEDRRFHGCHKYAYALKNSGLLTYSHVEPCSYGARTVMFERAGESEASDRYPIPTFEEMVEFGTPPKIIFDVAIQHKGTIVHAFEVVHKNDLTDVKREFIRHLTARRYVNVYTIDAAWILAQVRCPDRLVFREEFPAR
jgi:hypothetical protein